MFLLQKDVSTWVSEPGPHRALEAPGEGILWAGEGLLGPTARCSRGWRPSVLRLQSLRGDKLARGSGAHPGTRVFIEMKMNLAPHSTCSWTCVCSKKSYSSLWPYRQPWGRLEVCRESWAWTCCPAHPPSSPPWCRELYRGWTGAWEEFSVHIGLDKDSGG